jgi:hypothetical protein
MLSSSGLHPTNLNLLASRGLSLYGAWKKESLYGRTFVGIERTVFLIDEEGVIRFIEVSTRRDMQKSAYQIYQGKEASSAIPTIFYLNNEVKKHDFLWQTLKSTIRLL